MISYEKHWELEEEREKRLSNTDERRWSVRRKMAIVVFRRGKGREDDSEQQRLCVWIMLIILMLPGIRREKLIFGMEIIWYFGHTAQL